MGVYEGRMLNYHTVRGVVSTLDLDKHCLLLNRRIDKWRGLGSSKPLVLTTVNTWMPLPLLNISYNVNAQKLANQLFYKGKNYHCSNFRLYSLNYSRIPTFLGLKSKECINVTSQTVGFAMISTNDSVRQR